MSNSVTMKDVARAAGVSVMTVSRAFNRKGYIGEETRNHILSVAEQLGYVLDSTAANLRTQKTDFVAVIIPSLNNANFADTVSGISKVLAEQGLQPLLGTTGYDSLVEEKLIRDLLRRRPRVIVLTGGDHTPAARRMLIESGVPVLEIWDLPTNPIGHVVGFSNAATLELMVEHLVQTGRDRIAFIGGDANGDTRGEDRRRGFLAAMERRGLTHARLIPAGRPPVSMRNGALAMAHLLDDRKDTQAVICVSDLSAFGALTECQRRGVSVPDDLAIAGFGAYDIAEICHPPLTTINPYPEEIGTKAGKLIVDVLLDPEQQHSKTVTKIMPTLKIGGTTGF